MCVIIWRTTCHGCVADHSTCLVGEWARYEWQAWGPINVVVSCSIKPQSFLAVGSYLVIITAKPPKHPQVGTWCYMKKYRPWICCHPFHIFCGCMCKAWLVCDLINTLGSCQSKPWRTQYVRPDLVRTANNDAILSLAHDVICRTICPRCGATHFVCLVDT